MTNVRRQQHRPQAATEVHRCQLSIGEVARPGGGFLCRSRVEERLRYVFAVASGVDGIVGGPAYSRR